MLQKSSVRKVREHRYWGGNPSNSSKIFVNWYTWTNEKSPFSAQAREEKVASRK